MIVSAEELVKLPEFTGQVEEVLKDKLRAVELLIRAYTNNNFQNRYVRFCTNSLGDRLFATSDFLKVGDTVQISQSKVNDGLYTVLEIGEGFIRVDSDLYKFPENLVTKVEYPADIRAGVIELMKWEVKNRKKVGIQSETLSRHSVTYFNQDSANQVMGYPASLMGFLRPYMKARF